MTDTEDETVRITCRVSNARAVQAKELFALVDVEVQVAGVAIDILGVQARREPGDRTSVRLPTFKDADGVWRPAVRVPDEVRVPLADAVLAFLMEEGLAKRKFGSLPGDKGCEAYGGLILAAVPPRAERSQGRRSG